MHKQEWTFNLRNARIYLMQTVKEYRILKEFGYF